MVLEYPKKFIGQVNKITLVSVPCFFDGPPICESDEEQKLTISSSGRITYTSKTYAPYSIPPVSEGKWKKLNLLNETAQELLNEIIEPFRNYEIRPYCTDIGSWYLTAYNTDGEVFKYTGCLYSECFDKAESISYLIRNVLNMPDLYVFDGQSGLDSTKYIYLSVEFSEGGKTYYYRTDDKSIECGDYVVVPVGNYDKKVVKVVDVEEYSESDVPMPIEAVKDIIEKIEPPNATAKDDVMEAHKYSSNNYPELLNDSKCGCFYCLSIFDPKEVEEYIQENDNEHNYGTAICPYCGIDSVISESSGYPITEEFLRKMYRRWFDSGSGIALSTPMGSVELLLDGEPVSFRNLSIEPNERLFPDVDAAHRLTYDFVSDGKSHSLYLRIKDCKFEANPETGELLEAVSFYKDYYKITLGCIASFGDSEDYNLDYDGSLCEDGLEIYISKTTKSQTFKFGVCWIKECTDENDVQTWYGADPSI